MTVRKVTPPRSRKAGHRRWAAASAPVEGRHRGDIMSKGTRSALMSRIRGKNTGPERILFEELDQRGIDFKKHAKDLPGRPDIVFSEIKLAVNVDGDFWHGWRFPLWRHKLSETWQLKIAATRARDARNHQRLRRLGWKVLRIWEHEIENNLERSIQKILKARDELFAQRP
jgi:DNA mismatch endonuclease (patch repair protein)